MESLLHSLLEDGNTEGVTDICLDYALTREYSAEKWTEISGLAPFKDLELFSMSGHMLAQAGDFRAFPKLKQLNLSANEIEDISGLHDLPSLEFLDLSQNLLSNLGGLNRLPALREINLSHNYLRGLEDLPNFPMLSILKINHNRGISRFEPLSERNPQIRVLYAHHCFAGDFEVLEGMQALATLSISPGRPVDLQFLGKSSYLKTLTLNGMRWNGALNLPPSASIAQMEINSGQELDAVDGLGGFIALKRLSLKRLGLRKLPDLAGCRSLEELDISDTPLESLAADQLPAGLRKLRAKNTAISGKNRLEINASRPGLLLEF